MAVDWLQCLTLFASAFLAATIFPAQSEILLGSYITLAKQPWVLLIFVATLGNVLGSITSWWLGRGVVHFKNKKRFPFSEDSLRRSEAWFARYGVWTLLMSWLPIVGDALCVAAGVLRVPLTTFVILVTIGKLARYLFVAAVVLKLF